MDGSPWADTREEFVIKNSWQTNTDARERCAIRIIRQMKMKVKCCRPQRRHCHRHCHKPLRPLTSVSGRLNKFSSGAPNTGQRAFTRARFSRTSFIAIDRNKFGSIAQKFIWISDIYRISRRTHERAWHGSRAPNISSNKLFKSRAYSSCRIEGDGAAAPMPSALNINVGEMYSRFFVHWFVRCLPCAIASARYSAWSAVFKNGIGKK